MSAELAWFKSSYSGSAGGECIEVALDWRKSSHSGSQGGECIKVATSPHTIHVRDSKDPQGPTLTFTPEAWTTFVAHAPQMG
ncbi:DUF397 domain-containing protein [Streptomyces sp. NPDC054933]